MSNIQKCRTLAALHQSRIKYSEHLQKSKKISLRKLRNVRCRFVLRPILFMAELSWGWLKDEVYRVVMGLIKGRSLQGQLLQKL